MRRLLAGAGLVAGCAGCGDDRVQVFARVDRPRRILRARTRVAGVVTGERQERRILRRLGCPRRPPERQCDVDTGVFTSASAGGGAACATAQRVLDAAVPWFERECEWTCATRERFAGFRCTVAQVGEADWTITCRRGAQVVRSSVSY